MKNILITGGTGLVGQHLIRKLENKGYNVSLLSRVPGKIPEIRSYFWDPLKDEIEVEAITSADVIIHLAGAGIGDKRWTVARRREISESRVKSADLIRRTVRDTGKKLNAFISASGSGYYGTITSEKIFIETDPPATGFLGEVCRSWEETADRFSGTGSRVVKIRTGIVLAREGGVLKRIITPVRFGIGSPLGKGNQWVPWIHINDLCEIYIKAFEDQNMAGTFNAAAPYNITNRDLMKTMAEVLGKPFRFPAIPSVFLKIMFGEMSGIILEGSRISSEKILSAGFNFQFPELKDALQDLLR